MEKKNKNEGLSDIEKMIVSSNVARDGVPKQMVEKLRKKIYAEYNKLKKTDEDNLP